MKTHILFLALAAIARPALGAEKAARPESVAMTIAPAATPRLALKYELLPRYLEQTLGDAVPIYLKAAALQSGLAEPRAAFLKHYDEWMKTPPEKLPLDDVRTALLPFASALEQAAAAARRTRCQWDPPLREVEYPFSILLPELQDFRNLARVLAVRIRLRIAEHKFDEAIVDLQTGYAMARHVARMPFLVSALVGSAIAGMMSDQLQAFLQSPAAPNLYWAIASLPEPIIDYRPAYEVEKELCYLMFPQALALRRGGSLAESTVSPQETLDKLAELVLACGSGARAEKEFKTAVELLAPKARQELIAHGHSEKEVQALAPAQALLADMFEGYNEVRDELFKWLALSYPQARPGLEEVEARLAKDPKTPKPPRSVIAGLLLPALGSTKFTEARIARHLAALRIVEALRAHAAATAKLPASLAEIKDLPIPSNPVTGKPFPYRLENDGAILLADGPADRQQTEYRLKLAAPSR